VTGGAAGGATGSPAAAGDRPAVRILPAGHGGLLLDCADAGTARLLSGWLLAHRGTVADIDDVVPAERSVLLLGRRAAPVAALAERAVAAWPTHRPDADGALPGLRLRVRYDGPDLEEAAARAGLSREALVRMHQDADYQVAFCGFAPGFGYLTGAPEELWLPRRERPRTAVPAGAVGIAGRYTGVYPRVSPGGWNLVGSLAEPAPALWDPDRDPAALLAPGRRVRFVAVDQGTDTPVDLDRVTGSQAADDPAGRDGSPRPAVAPTATRDARRPTRDGAGRGGTTPASAGPPYATTGARPASGAVLQVRAAVGLITVQDAGRPGWAHVGVPRSGALDLPALRLANRLVGNDDDAAGLEITVTGCTIELSATRWVAVTGAVAALTIGGRAAEFGTAALLPAGVPLVVGAALAGVRCYLAVGGGLTPRSMLGSRSTDLLSGLGPAPLRAGDTVPLGAAPRRLPAGVDGVPTCVPDTAVTLALAPGPRADAFAAGSLDLLYTSTYTVTQDSNRIGLHLAGPRLRAAPDAGLRASEGVPHGGLQVPADGAPLLFLADHPVTGGYPVIGCVPADDLPSAAQAAPGTEIRFRRAR
jgi:biotin-dependent carboxylase-like uncharacterized protein